MIKTETKFFIKDVIINQNGHLNNFLEFFGRSEFTSTFNMYFLSDSSVFIKCVL